MTFDMIVKAAMMAGQAMTLDEIATALGVKNPRAVRQALSLYGIQLDPKPGGLRRFLIWLSDERQRELAIAARRHRMDEEALLQRAVKLMLEDDMVGAIIDDHKVKRPAT